MQYRIASYTLNTDNIGTANLPAITNASNGYTLFFRNMRSIELTINPAGEETINGKATKTLTMDQWRLIHCDSIG